MIQHYYPFNIKTQQSKIAFAWNTEPIMTNIWIFLFIYLFFKFSLQIPIQYLVYAAGTFVDPVHDAMLYVGPPGILLTTLAHLSLFMPLSQPKAVSCLLWLSGSHFHRTGPELAENIHSLGGRVKKLNAMKCDLIFM